MEESEKEAHRYRESLKRLSTQEFWEKFKKFYKIKNLNEFSIDIYEKLEAYHAVLEAKVKRATRATQEALESCSVTKLNIIRAEIETNISINGRLRLLLKNEEENMQVMLRSIDASLRHMGQKPNHIFYRPKPKKVVEDVRCPHCKKTNPEFEYNMPCRHCHEFIGNPWKEHTICPEPECNHLINRSDIYGDPSAYKLDTHTKQITCPYCETRFDWKKYRNQPEKYGLKICINCDRSFNPDKYNWLKQRLCPECKKANVDCFKLDNPGYQKKYRSKKK